MSIELLNNTAEYSCRRKPTPEEHEKIRDRISDPYTLTGIDRLKAFYEWQGLEFDESIFEDIIKEYPPDG